jgi:hypothetical protein
MKTIYRDDFTGSIAVSCSEEKVATIDYFGTVKEAIAWYPDAIVYSSLQEESTLKVSVNYDEDIVTIEVNNQVLRLSLFQAEQLKSIL